MADFLPFQLGCRHGSRFCPRSVFCGAAVPSWPAWRSGLGIGPQTRNWQLYKRGMFAPFVLVQVHGLKIWSLLITHIRGSPICPLTSRVITLFSRVINRSFNKYILDQCPGVTSREYSSPARAVSWGALTGILQSGQSSVLGCPHGNALVLLGQCRGMPRGGGQWRRQGSSYKGCYLPRH